jgi:FAD/FMN-containing dehydrogenase
MALKQELAGILAPDRVYTDAKTLDSYSRDTSYAKPLKPRAVVKPASAAEVQAVVQWANQTGAPLVPVSSGPPHFHGGTVPGVAGAVVVDLGGLKRIFRVDRRNRIAMFEAGVTYPELQPALAKEGLRLTMPLLPRAGKSVVASLLEREPTLVPRQQWASLEPLRCTEIIWGDGHRFATGDAGNWTSMEGAWERKQAAAGPAGPGQADFYRLVSGAQGSMGIVTWASAKCEVLPQLHKLFLAPASQLDDLLDFTYQLLKFRFADELMIVNGFVLASIVKSDPAAVSALAAKLPPWVALVGIAGRSILPREKVESQEKDIAEIAQKHSLKLAASVSGVKGAEVLKALVNPSRETCWKLDYKGGFQDIFFLTTLGRTPGFLKTMDAVAGAAGYPAADIGVYIQPQQQGANCHCEFILPYDPADAGESARIQGIFTKASRELYRQGAYYSRPYGIWADMAYQANAPATEVLKKVKGIFDPNHIMNPGKLCF